MRLKFCCTRQRRIILTNWESKSSPLSNLSGRNTPIFWNKNGKPILPISRLHNVRANVEYLLEISSPPQPQRRKIPSIRFVCFWFLAFQRNAQPLPPAMISGVWGYVTNKHLAGIPETGFLLNTQSYVRLHCLPVSVFRIS